MSQSLYVFRIWDEQCCLWISSSFSFMLRPISILLLCWYWGLYWCHTISLSSIILSCQFLHPVCYIPIHATYIPILLFIALWRKPHWKWEIKEFAKMTTSSPIFGRYELFQIKYLDTTFGQFHFLAYIWYELIIQRRQTFLIALFSWSSSRLAEGCEKSEGTTWTDS